MSSAKPTTTGDLGPPLWFQTVGTTLAVSSGFFIGLSLIMQKKGLLLTSGDRNDGPGADPLSYLKNPWWWSGIITM